MKRNKDIEAIIEQCVRCNLKSALDALENYLLTRQEPRAFDRLQQSQLTYRMLLQTWKEGRADSLRSELYQKLLRDCYETAAALLYEDCVKNTFTLNNMRGEALAHRKDWSIDLIGQELESFVAERSLLELEPPHTRASKEKELYRQHALMMNDVFNHLATSGPLGYFSGDLRNILVSDLSDTLDRQLMVSAVTLSLLNCFDYGKWQMLADVCNEASDDALRGRALVGMALTADTRMAKLYPAMEQTLRDLMQKVPDIQEQLYELQMQLVYCLRTEEDSRTIHDELMPEMIKNAQVRITPKGIEEADEDSLEDILHPEKSEQRIEQVEKVMERMGNMIREGIDIYYAGFSQTKRLPFFSAVSNWFVPFYSHHPAISSICDDAKKRQFFEPMLKLGTFCNSDKYSFILIFQQVFDQLPDNIKNAMHESKAAALDLMEGQMNTQTPTFLRRVYLQDLFRFFRLHPHRESFVSPFDDQRYLFMAQPLLRSLFDEGQTCRMAAFLIKAKRIDDAIRLMQGWEGSTLQFHLLCGRLAQTRPEAFGHTAEWHYDQALVLNPNHPKALKAKARILFQKALYQEAYTLYQRLSLLDAENEAYPLYAATCQANMEQYDEALKTLFRLHYQAPESQAVTRVLAWTLMACGRLDEALAKYQRMDGEGEDLLNHAYCLWMKGQVADAAVLVEQSHLPITEADAQMLRRSGVSDTEIQLMRENYEKAE